jgi:hypothetical protein
MKQKILSWVCDVAVAVGFFVFCYGLWLAWKPLGFILGGLAMASGAFFIGYGLKPIARRE